VNKRTLTQRFLDVLTDIFVDDDWVWDWYQESRSDENKQLMRVLAKEREFTQTLDWTPEALRAYDARVVNIDARYASKLEELGRLP